MPVQQSKPKNLQIRATSRRRRLVPEALDDLGAQPAVVGLGRHLQTEDGHTRAYELVLGGVTRTLLDSMTVPVLMSH